MSGWGEIKFQKWVTLSVVVLALAVAALFGRSINFDFIDYDDPVYVYDQEFVSQGVTTAGLKWAMTGVGETNLWHPITWISHMIDVELFGVDNAGGHHGVNVVWHMLGSIGLFFLLRRLTGSIGIALFLAMLWALHPHRVQSVLWISERKDVLSGAFFVWSWYAWERWRASEGNGRALFGVALVLFGMAAMSKPSVIPLPLILWLREMLRDDAPLTLKRGVKWAVSLTPFILVSLLVAGVTIYFQKTGGLSATSEIVPFTKRAMLMPNSLWWYLKGFVWCSPGQFWVYPPEGNFSDMVLPGIGLIITITTISFVGYRRRIIWLGAGVVFALWMPVSGVVPVSFYYVADRYSYLIHLGVLIILGGVLQIASLRVGKFNRPRIQAIFAGVILLTAAIVSFGRVGLWRNSETLFSHERSINPRSLLAPIQLGIVRHRQEKYEDALMFFREALQIDQNSGLAANRAGMALEKLGRKAEAESMYASATQKMMLNSESPYSHWARLLVEQGDFKKAKSVLLKGLQRFPNNVTLQIDLASIALSYEKDATKALKWYRLALQGEPYNPHAMQGEGVALIVLGRKEEGRAVLRKLIARYPDRKAVGEFLKKNSP